MNLKLSNSSTRIWEDFVDEHKFIYKISPSFHALLLVHIFSYPVTNVYELTSLTYFTYAQA